MAKRLMCVFSVVAGLWLLLSACVDPREATPTRAPAPTSTEAPAVRVAADETFYGEAADGYIEGDSSTYSSARADSDTCDEAGATGRVGQGYSGGRYKVWRGFLSFDTSGIPDDAVIDGAVLWLCSAGDTSLVDFEVELYGCVWAEALCTNREANYDAAFGSVADFEGEWQTASGWTADTYYTMTMATAWISNTGDTKYCIRSSRDVASLAPGEDQYVEFYTADQAGTDKDPKLIVSYTEPTPTPTNTSVPTSTPTNTPTPTSTPTVTPICPVSIQDDTTWGPGTVRVQCNTGVWSNTALTITAGTDVVFLGDHKIDVQGRLYAVGTAADPITFSHASGVTKSLWSYVHLRGDASTLDYCVIQAGRGINDVAGSTIRHTEVMSCDYGLATMSDSDVMSCTFQYNTYGIVPYLEGSPAISYCNILSNTWNVYMDQISDLDMWYVWWGADPPDGNLLFDGVHDFILGLVDVTFYLSSWLAW